MELIQLKGIRKNYDLGRITLPVLKGITLAISEGEFVALMGKSGSGKTTLMNILGCLDRPTSGHYHLAGRNVSELSADERAIIRNRQIGFVFQNFNLLPRTSAIDNVMTPLSYAPNGTDSDGRNRAEELIRKLGLADHMDQEPSQLSGGQQQRVAIARALINRPSLVLADEPTGNLDSRTSEEVLRAFQKLNEEEGVTIVLITHDPTVAASAGRVIHMHDGIIGEQDSRRALADETPEQARLDGLSPAGFRFGTIIRTALNGLRRNIMRAALTTIGIIIGVAAVIAMMQIGSGSSAAIRKTIASMGVDILVVIPGTASSGGVNLGTGSELTLTPDDGEAIAKECPSVKAAAPVIRARTQVVYGNRNWVPIFIYGTTPDFLKVRRWSIEEGEMFSERDVRNSTSFCVLGQRLVDELFQGKSPVGEDVRIQNVAFRVIGVLERKGANMMGMDQDDVVIAPWTTVKNKVTGLSVPNVNQSPSSGNSDVNSLNQIYPTVKQPVYPQQSATQQADSPAVVKFANVDQILATARSTSEIAAAVEEITSILRERHRIRAGQPEDFSIRDMTEITNTFSSTTALMTKLLLAVALISLAVGGVGIMNIMLVSVTERTREIGLRMAIGARRANILQQFLTESVFLCLLGGLIGILVGQTISLLVSKVLNWPIEYSGYAIVAAVAVSTTVGVAFGYYPAWKASRQDPITALRYE